MADVARAVDNQMAISFALTLRVLSYSNKSNNNVFFRYIFLSVQLKPFTSCTKILVAFKTEKESFLPSEC